MDTRLQQQNKFCVVLRRQMNAAEACSADFPTDPGQPRVASVRFRE